MICYLFEENLNSEKKLKIEKKGLVCVMRSIKIKSFNRI